MWHANTENLSPLSHLSPCVSYCVSPLHTACPCPTPLAPLTYRLSMSLLAMSFFARDRLPTSLPASVRGAPSRNVITINSLKD